MMMKRDKRVILNELYDEYIKKFNDEVIVTGIGNVDARILLIGEAPGRDEIKKNEPFVGAAGKNLNNFLDSINLKREEIYITNSIKYRLCRPSILTCRIINAPAKRIDIEINREYLLREIGIISPEIIVTLGNVPLKSVTGDFKLNIGDVHGKLLNIKVKMHSGDKRKIQYEAEQEVKLFPLYHPASIIYNRSLQDIYQEDVMKLKKILFL